MVMTKLPAAPDTKFEFLNVHGAAPLNRHQRVWAPKYKTFPSHGTGGGGGPMCWVYLAKIPSNSVLFLSPHWDTL